MPTLIEIPEAVIPNELQAADACGPKIGCHPPPPAPPHAGRILFSDSLLERSSSERHRRGLATTFSFALECLLVGFLFLLPLMFTEALPTQQLLTLLVAPAPPPPPPPPPAAPPVSRVVQTDMLNNGQLRAPTRIPRKVELIREEETPPPTIAGGVIGGAREAFQADNWAA